MQNKRKSALARRRKTRKIAITLLLVLLALVLTAGGVLAYNLLKGDQWLQFDPDKLVNLHQTTWLYDSEGNTVVNVHGGENRTKILIRSLPLHVPYAFVAAEDARFYTHNGIDVQRIFGALWADIKSGSLDQGASTITQQLIKLTHLTSEKTWTRKLTEAILAFQLEQHYTKDAILEMYLNVVYFGRGAYGIEAAAQSYFGIPATELTLEQSACLAAILKAPSNYAPHLKPENNKKRRDMILNNMHELGYITAQQASAAIEKPISVIEKADEETFTHGWFMDQAISEAEKLLDISGEEFLSGGYRIYTTMSEDVQSIAEDIYTQSSLFPQNADDGTPPESAMVVMDSRSGAVRGLIGGREYTVRKGLNRATQSRRSPGSAFKPIVAYAPAIENNNYSPVTMFNDEKTTFPGDYTPKNIDGKDHGWVTMREAIAKSYNISAVKCLEEIGVRTGREFAIRLGIKLDDMDANLSMALGSLTNGVTPVEMAGAYQVFANGGVKNSPYFIEYIVDSNNTVLYQHEQGNERIMKEENAYLMTDLLRTVAEEGTGKKLADLNMPIAAKTGTNGFEDLGNRDIWMAAYNPEYTVSVWMGFDITDAQHYLRDDVTGGGVAAEVVREFFSQAYTYASAPGFVRPEGIIEQTIDMRVLESDHIAVLATDSTPKKYRLTEIFTPWSRIGEDDVSNLDGDVPEVVRQIVISINSDGYPEISFEGVQEGVRYSLIRVEDDGRYGVFSASGEGVHTYVDEDVAPDTTYEYYVIGTDTRTDAQSEESPHVFIQTPGADEHLPEPEPSPTEDEDWPWPEPTPIPTPEPDPEPTLPEVEPTDKPDPTDEPDDPGDSGEGDIEALPSLEDGEDAA